MPENFVSVRIYHHQAKDMVNVAQENLRARNPKYTNIDTPRIIAEMANRKLEISTAYTEKELKSARNSIRKFIHRSVTEQINRFQEFHKTKSGKGRKWQSNQQTFDHAIISFSSAGLENVSNEDLLRLGKIWAERWATENHIKNLYICLHLDEKTPHLHLCFENITAEGISFRRKVTKATLSHCQDLAGEVFGEIGFRRGISRELTAREHEDAKEYNRRVLIEQEKKIQQKEEDISNLTLDRDQLLNELMQVKTEIAALRRKKEEQAAADREEEKKRKAEISALRKQKKTLLEEILAIEKWQEKVKAEQTETRQKQQQRKLAVARAEYVIDKQKNSYVPEPNEEQCLKRIGSIARCKAAAENTTPEKLLNKLCAEFNRSCLQAIDRQELEAFKTHENQKPPKGSVPALPAEETAVNYEYEPER